MRKHKFKAWSIPEKRWINLNGFCISFNGCDDEGAVYEVTEQGVLHVIAVEDVKIIEWTGLSDKNGKEIYEGDIVTTTYGKYDLEPNGLTRFGTVVYDIKTARFAISIKNSAVLVSFYDVNKIEISGNIYDLKGESQ